MFAIIVVRLFSILPEPGGNFVRELSSRNRGPVIRTDETTISDDGRHVIVYQLPRTYICPCGIYRGEYLEGNFFTLFCCSFDLHENPYLMNQLLGNMCIYIYIYIYMMFIMGTYMFCSTLY